jgi:hypothetical protein
MASPPVNDHTEEFEQLAGLSALDVLEGDELARFEQHAAQCERCRVIVRLDREALALAAPEMEPSPDFKERLMQAAAQELANRPVDLAARRAQRDQAQVEIAPRQRPPIWRRSTWLSALAALLVIALVSVGAFTYQNQVVATYALTGSAAGSATVNVRRSGATELVMNGVPNPAPGYVYEAWIIPQGGQPVAAGTTSSGTATLPLDGVSSGSTVAVTQERSRVDAPTSSPILATVVQA